MSMRRPGLMRACHMIQMSNMWKRIQRRTNAIAWLNDSLPFDPNHQYARNVREQSDRGGENAGMTCNGVQYTTLWLTREALIALCAIDTALGGEGANRADSVGGGPPSRWAGCTVHLFLCEFAHGSSIELVLRLLARGDDILTQRTSAWRQRGRSSHNGIEMPRG